MKILPQRIRRLSLLLFLMICTINAVGQSNYRDSIKLKMSLLEQPNEYLINTISNESNSERLSILYNLLGLNYQRENAFDAAMRSHQRALRYAFLIGKPNEEIAISYNKIGIVFYFQANCDSAIANFEKALPYYESQHLKANTYTNIGLMNNQKLNRDLAIENYLKALEIFKAVGDTVNQGNLYNNIGALYLQIEDYEKAEFYLKEGLNLSDAEEFDKFRYDCKLNLGNVFFHNGETEKAISIFLEVEAHFTEKEEFKTLIIVKNSLANCYDELGKWSTALELYHEALEIIETHGIIAHKGNILSNVGTIYEKKGDYGAAIGKYNQARLFMLENGQTAYLESVYSNLSSAYEQMGILDSSLYYKNSEVALRDSLDELEKQKKMMEIESEHQLSQLEETLAKQNLSVETLEGEKGQITFKLILTFIGLGIAVIIITLLIFRFLKKKRLTEALTENEKALSKNMKGLKDSLKSKEKEIEKLKENPQQNKTAYPKNLTRLTTREVEVLELVKQGLKDSEIAEKLFLSVATVRTHLRKAYVKIDVRNRAEAIHFISQYEI